jgi:hypothetical protein
VFTNAVNVEAEGAKYFEEFITVKTKLMAAGTETTAIPSSSSSQAPQGAVDTDADADADADDDVGGFCQPTGLAQFVKKIRDPSVHSDEMPQSQLHTAETLTDPSDDLEKNNMNRQICRAWLKHSYLKIGQPCKNANCERRHDLLNMNVGNLYKDYSFKGLPTAQRNAIIKQVQNAAQSGGDQHPSSCDCCRSSGSSNKTSLKTSSAICTVVGTSTTRTSSSTSSADNKNNDGKGPARQALLATAAAPSVSAGGSRKRSLHEIEPSADADADADADTDADDDSEGEGEEEEDTHRRWKPSRPWGPLHLDSKRWF